MALSGFRRGSFLIKREIPNKKRAIRQRTESSSSVLLA
ncbi:hypothetical protein GP5015_2318 [gamma proteobacterium HTCC5015]|nr:hypothetical protein GP5015_2318 [gamma proteobacterium HTCC5015]